MKKVTLAAEKQNIRWALVGYDLAVFAVTVLFYIAGGSRYMKLTVLDFVSPCLFILVFVFTARFIFKIYQIIWRYGGVQSYIRLIMSDGCAFVLFFIIDRLTMSTLPFVVYAALFVTDLLFALTIRMVYRYIYKCCTPATVWGRLLCRILGVFNPEASKAAGNNSAAKIAVAIVGAGSSGISLAEEMITNTKTPYAPRMFIDIDPEKIGRIIHDLPVYSQSEVSADILRANEIQEIIFAVPASDRENLHDLYREYSGMGYKVKTYDYPVLGNPESGRRQLRDFDIEDLLFRKQIVINDPATAEYYKDKVILITGGGGSIGSELCRQLAKLSPRQIILADIYENGAYDVQQELRLIYGRTLDLRIAIVSVTNRRGLERVFRKYRPQIVINAAAHKHVPLMEDDCIEAVENNVFGTLNAVELSEKYKVEKFIQVSTDKAVNPTNVMGATKRMCEFITGAHAASGTETKFSATRFGNVLGSAGSVVPLFKRQIANGGPITVTDRRIIRYFMTIPEASRLVLQSGAMARNGELFVLDMGRPVKIYELAESMIRLSGLTPGKDIEIKETGLRPGEKLFEELLVQGENLSKTDNDLIFIEKDAPISMAGLQEKLDLLKAACESDSDEAVRGALRQVVPTYIPKGPEAPVEPVLDGPDTYKA